jgi:hypothetical protein
LQCIRSAQEIAKKSKRGSGRSILFENQPKAGSMHFPVKRGTKIEGLRHSGKDVSRAIIVYTSGYAATQARVCSDQKLADFLHRHLDVIG